MSTGMNTDEEKKKLRNRNWVVGGILASIVILFYLITLVKLTMAPA